MSDGHCAIRLQEKLGHRASHEDRPAHHHGPQPRQVLPEGLPQQDHASHRGAGGQSGKALGKSPSIHNVQSVDVLVRIDGLDDGLFVQPGRKRHLNQDAMDRRVDVQGPNEVNQDVLRRIC